MRIARWIMLAIAALAVLTMPAPTRAQVAVGVSVEFAPPDLPIYEQPPCPGEGYVWTPGYWAYDNDDGYYWVPGTWVPAPVGLLWTPGYWAWQNAVYVWYPGYWGPVVGFYGGVNYGFGYVGTGYEGGYWNHGAFYYNRSVNNVRNVTNVYNKTVINNVTVNNVSYNGGQGGTSARPTPDQQAAARAQHTAPIAAQVQHEQEARTNRSQLASVNHGKPGVAATMRPSDFKSSAVSAKAAAPYSPPPARNANRPEQPNRPANPPPTSRPEPSNPPHSPRQTDAAPENRGRSANPQQETRPPQSQPRQEQQPQRPNAEEQRRQEQQGPAQRAAQPPPQDQRRASPPQEQHRQEQPQAQPKPQERAPEHQPEQQQEQRKQKDENQK